MKELVIPDSDNIEVRLRTRTRVHSLDLNRFKCFNQRGGAIQELIPRF